MSPRPHDGPAEDGLSSSLLRIVHDPEQLARLRGAMSGFCHRCRNSLNGIKMSLYLFRREAMGAAPDCWGEIESTYQELEHFFDHLQAIYRPLTIAMVRSPLDELIRQHVPRWRSWLESRGLSLQLDPSEPEVCGDFDPAQLGAGLDALAAWRAEVGAPGVLACVGWGARDGSIEIRWGEATPDGPPSPFDLAEVPTGRDPAGGSRPVDVLALPLLGRIVAAHGGRLHREPGHGFRIRLRWPQYHRAGRDGAA